MRLKAREKRETTKPSLPESALPSVQSEKMSDDEAVAVELTEKKKAKRRKPSPAGAKSTEEIAKAGNPAKRAPKNAEPADKTPRQSTDSVRYSTDDSERRMCPMYSRRRRKRLPRNFAHSLLSLQFWSNSL